LARAPIANGLTLRRARGARRALRRVLQDAERKGSGHEPVQCQPARDRHELAASPQPLGAEASLEDAPHRRHERRASRHWIARPLAAIAECADRTLETAGVVAADVDRVFTVARW